MINSKRLYYLLIGSLILMVVGLLAAAYGVNALLSARAHQLVSLKAKNQALQREQASLVIAKDNVQKYADLEKIAKSVVPQDKNQAETVRQIVNIAGANGIALSAINFPASSLGNNVAVVGAGAATPATTTSSSSSTNSNTGKLSQLQPVKSIPGVYVLPITVQSDPSKPVPYSSIINFLNALEHNRRTALISGITLQPSTTNPNLLTFTLTLNEYLKP